MFSVIFRSVNYHKYHKSYLSNKPKGKFYFSLYDKRNDYDFDVISFPFLDGNIPKGQSYGVFL